MPSAPNVRRSRGIALAACVGLTATLGAVAPGITGGAAHAAPAEDCAEAFPVAEVAPDQAVHGVTVSKGTTPAAFTGTVLGVLEDGIGAGRDMIMMDLTSPAIEAAGGIWQGMSGSPVYAEDGRLIGAVAYGLSWGSSPIAGITPFEYMDDYLGPADAAPARIPVGDKAATKIARTGEVTRAQADQGFEQLPMRFSISGISNARLTGARDHDNRPYLRGLKSSRSLNGTAAGADAASVDTLIAGGSLAAVQSVGDVTYAGVGTVTSVCDGELVGFGHPMAAIGQAQYGLAAADVVHVQPDSLGAPFKVSNIGEVGGTIDSDRLSGIAGPLGPVPATTTFVSDITFEGDHRVGETDVFLDDALASVAFGGMVGNHDSVMDYYGPGSESQDWEIEGTDEKGNVFSISYSDLFQSSYDIAYDASYALADTLYVMSQMNDVAITSVTSTAVASDDDSVYRVRKVEQKVGGEWVLLDNEERVKVKAGTTLNLRATLVNGGDQVTVPLSWAVPKKAAGTRGSLEVAGGAWDWLDVYEADTVAQMKRILASDSANNSVVGSVRLRGDGNRINASFESAEVDLVVERSKYLDIIVK
ncbi:F0F1-type ATP synthase membrane subunit c/vacuolar-type H+-ATPase subunit K [Nocardioides thalensis]|uniref:F0F1-type ATP synthase membrane subunit c/vacuolar-type H+-ATPase subunit K n=1 Tax=Nocardioides thalensis TaxID=1914755 RepID=A0A853C1G6_9ACTN|nr:SpoIVB peptidase S55 domain-containing protein [Nocardioides thalensis]NYJ01445.1 F0F1-type ATP synthase membrane subunit c/vacuolar-type H+-ATPase subunit K [Nocardioides thalensis]